MKNSKLQFKIKNYIQIILVGVFVIAGNVSAAEIFVTSADREIGIGGQTEVAVVLDTQNEKINALEGKLVFPEDLLELKEIRDGSSVINFWIERPKLSSTNGITFSGVIPGGFDGRDASIFSVIFTAKKEGSDVIKLEGMQALLNDGSGTPAKISLVEYYFVVSASGRVAEIPQIIDQNPPESFVPEVGSDPGIFDGKYFVAFLTQDKASGIDYYEVKEKWWPLFFLDGKWQRAESPFELKNQRLSSYIYVKAVDKSGNERIEIISPDPLAWYESRLFWCIIIVVVPIVFFIQKIWRRKKAKSALN